MPPAMCLKRIQAVIPLFLLLYLLSLTLLLSPYLSLFSSLFPLYAFFYLLLAWGFFFIIFFSFLVWPGCLTFQVPGAAVEMSKPAELQAMGLAEL